MPPTERKVKRPPIQLTERVLPMLTGPWIFYDRLGDRRVPGLGFRVTTKGTKSWTFDYSSGGRRRRVNIDRWPNLNLEQARAAARKLQTGVAEHVDPLEQKHQARTEAREAHERTVAGLAELWRAQVRKRPKPLRTDDSMLRRHILPRLGDRPVSEISAADVKNLMAKITADGHPTQANRVRALLSVLLNFAIDLEWIAANPVTRVKPSHEEKRIVHLSDDDMKRLADAMDAHPNKQVGLVVRFLVATGCRVDEALGARWSEFNLQQRRWVRPAERLKQKSNSIIPLNAIAVGLLTQMHAANGSHEYVFHGVRPGDRLHNIVRPWVQIREAAGLPKLRLHDMRHHFVTKMLENPKVPIESISQLIGHSSSTMTRRYANWSDSRLAEIAEMGSSALALPTP